MKISMLVKQFIVMFVVLSIINVTFYIISNNANRDAQKALENQAEYKRLGLQLMDASDFLTQQAQAYVQYGEKRYFDAYWYEINTAKNRDNAIAGLTALGAPKNELDLVAKAGQLSNTLALLEDEAFKEVENGNFEKARELMFGSSYDIGKTPIIETMTDFQNTMNTRALKEVENARKSADLFQIAAMISTVIFAFAGITFLLLLLRKIMPINYLVKLVTEVSDGNINVNTDRSLATKDEIGMLALDIYTLIDVVKSILGDMERLAVELHVNGDIEYRIDPSKYKGSYKEMINGTNGLVNEFVEDIAEVQRAIDELGRGNFNVKTQGLPPALCSKIDLLTTSLNNIYSEIEKIATNVTEGNLEIKVDSGKYEGGWAKLIKELNDLVSVVANPLSKIEYSLSEMSKGNFIRISENYKGTFDTVKQAVNKTREITLDYIEEIAKILDAIANGDLTITINHEYAGSYAPIKQSLNTILISLNKTMNEINNAAEQVLSSAAQISTSSALLAEGASKQESVVQDLTSSVNIINEKTKINSQNAVNANDLVRTSTKHAQDGNETMLTMISSMNGIKESSTDISKIIRTIEDIAFQTNLLALNAAVEAARAGAHGNGFAVVAEEVRNLAARSQKSAKDTTALIEGSNNKVDGGMTAAHNTSDSLETIINDVRKISGIISQISDMSVEQSQSIAQISVGVNEISSVIQTNSSTSEETASASQELNSQAELLKQLVSFFSLKSM